MLKKIKPGQIYHPWTIAGNVRAKKRICGCNGCILNNFITCPEVRPKNNNFPHETPNCEENNIIFVKP